MINDEKSETYSWILRPFFQTNKKPTLIVSDGDKALVSAIGIEAKDIHHRLCSWHLSKNLRQHFNYLKADICLQEFKESLFVLSYLTDKTKFNNSVKNIIQFLEANEFTK